MKENTIDNKKDKISDAKKTEKKFIPYTNLDKIGEIPVYYGFVPHESPEIKKIDLDQAKSLMEGDFIDNDENTSTHLPLHVEEKVALLRMYTEANMYTWPQPVMFYFKEPFKNSKQIKRMQITIGIVILKLWVGQKVLLRHY